MASNINESNYNSSFLIENIDKYVNFLKDFIMIEADFV